jgi:hypothetical protein
MLKINRKVKGQRLTKSLVLGIVRMVSYKELKDIQAERAAKEEAAASKGKRGRKRKSFALEGSALNATANTIQTRYGLEP